MRFDYSKLLGRIREKGLTQAQLAKIIGISETTLNFGLSNKRPFKRNEILSLCAALEIPAKEIDVYFFSHQTLEI